MSLKRRRSGSDEVLLRATDTLVVHFHNESHLKSEVLRDYACKVCNYIKAQLELNEEIVSGDTEVYIVGVTGDVARALQEYLHFDSKSLMSLPSEDLLHLVRCYGLVEIEAEMNRREVQRQSLNRRRTCSYCQVVFTDLENDMTSCPRRTLDAVSRLCVRCSSSASFCRCPCISHKHEE